MTAPAIDVALRCVASDPQVGQICGSLAAAKVTAACVHEHVLVALACQQHLDELAHSFATCKPCEICSDPHVCEARVVDLTAVEDLPVPATPTET